MSVPVILDCDPGHDDAFAILLAAGSPLADLRAITTVGGNGTLEAVTQNALKVCTLAGIRDVPVAAGAAGPLRGELHTAADVHGESGLDGPDLPDPDIELDPRPAIELMADVLREADEPVTLVPTGPLTNVANLLTLGARRAREDRRDRVDGRRARARQPHPYAEFNAWVDPEAAEIVVASGVPFTLVGLQLTHQALATPEVVERIRGVGGQLAGVAADWLGYFSSTYREIWGFDAPLHDPCALALALDPTLATSSRRSSRSRRRAAGPAARPSSTPSAASATRRTRASRSSSTSSASGRCSSPRSARSARRPDDRRRRVGQPRHRHRRRAPSGAGRDRARRRPDRSARRQGRQPGRRGRTARPGGRDRRPGGRRRGRSAACGRGCARRAWTSSTCARTRTPGPVSRSSPSRRTARTRSSSAPAPTAASVPRTSRQRPVCWPTPP